MLEARRSELERIEADPSDFYRHHVGRSLVDALVPVAGALGADPGDLAWVPNTTFGLNLVARSLVGRLGPGDEVLTTDLEYGSQVMLWRWLCERAGAELRFAPVGEVGAEDVPGLLESLVTSRTRVAFLSHITSATARRLPVEDVARRLRARGVVVVVDGAHAPGQIPLDLHAIGCNYYVGNLHKWFGAPRGAAVLHAPGPEAQSALDPLVVSWGGTDPSSLLAERVHSPGTVDPTTYLAAPAGVAFHREVLAPARSAARARLGAAASALAALGFERVGGQEEDLMMAAFWFPEGAGVGSVAGAASVAGVAGVAGFASPEDRAAQDGSASRRLDPARLGAALQEAKVEAILTEKGGRSLLRICVAWYTTDEDIERLLGVLGAWLGRSGARGSE